MLRLRILTAAILIPLVLLSIFYLSQTLFSVACGAVILLAAWEWAELIGIEEYWMKACYLIILVCLYIFSQQVLFPWILMVGLAWWLIAAVWLLIYPKGEAVWRSKVIRTVIGILMLLPCWVGLVSLQGDFTRLGPWYLLFMLFIVWAMDIGAYFIGRICGKNPLAPRVSPKKTVEGLYGGLGLALLVAIGFIIWFHLSWQHALLVIGICLLTALLSVIGDLVESMFKRYQQVKDSGSILPGHGGILDRIDSLLAVVPLYTLIITLIELKGLS